MTAKPCKCTTVQPRENGIWACMRCNREFVALDQIEIADEQKPVKPLTKELNVPRETSEQNNR